MRSIDKIDILINFVIYAIIWLIISSIAANLLKKETRRFTASSFIKRWAIVAPFTFVGVFLIAYIHFKSTDFNMKNVSALFLFYSNKVLVFSQFIVVFIAYIRTKSIGFLMLLIAFSITFSFNVVSLVFDVRGLSISSSITNVIWEIYRWVGLISKVFFIVGIYYIMNDYRNKALQQKNNTLDK